MNIPPEFSKIGMGFDPGFRNAIPDGQDIFSFALAGLTAQEKNILKKFLNDVLATVSDPSELQRIWRQARSRTYIPDDRQLRALLQEIVDRID